MSIGHGIEAGGTAGEGQPDGQSAWEQMYADAAQARAAITPNTGQVDVPEQMVPSSETIPSPAANVPEAPAVATATSEQPGELSFQQPDTPLAPARGDQKNWLRTTRGKITAFAAGTAALAGAIFGGEVVAHQAATSPPAATAEQNPGGNNLTTAVSTTSSEALTIHQNTAPTTVRGAVADPGNLKSDLQISELAGTVVPWNGKQTTLLPMLAKDTYYGPNQEADYTANTMGNAVLQNLAYLISGDSAAPEYQQVLEHFSSSPSVQTYVTSANAGWHKEHPGADLSFFDTSDSPVNFLEQIRGTAPVVGVPNGTLYMRAIDRSLERTFGDSANNSKFDAAPVELAFEYDTTVRSDGYTGIVITSLALSPAQRSATNSANTAWFNSMYFNAGNVPGVQ